MLFGCFVWVHKANISTVATSKEWSPLLQDMEHDKVSATLETYGHYMHILQAKMQVSGILLSVRPGDRFCGHTRRALWKQEHVQAKKQHMKHAKHPAGLSMQSLPTRDFQTQWEHQRGNLDGLLNCLGFAGNFAQSDLPWEIHQAQWKVRVFYFVRMVSLVSKPVYFAKFRTAGPWTSPPTNGNSNSKVP